MAKKGVRKDGEMQDRIRTDEEFMYDALHFNFTNYVKKQMKEYDIGQNEIAREARISKYLMSLCLHDRHNFTLKTMTKISAGLNRIIDRKS